MRKNLLFGWMVLMLAIVPGFNHQMQAQTWTAPTLTGSTLATGTTYYVYNVGSNGYLNRGGYWGTGAVVTTFPKANASASINKWTAVNTSGSTWTFQYNNAGANISNNYLFAASTTDGSVFTDNSTNNTWDVVLTDAATNTYSIQVVSTYGGYNATQYLGSASTTESTNKGIATIVRSNRASGDNYTKWKFASQADLDLYNARVLLDRYMNYAKLRGGIDISAYITTYNAGVTADINTEAANLLTALGRTSVTVPNFSFETDAVQTGWDKVGSWANQTNTPLFTKDATNYTEKYIASGSNLGTGTITQTITGLANGLYGLVAVGHAVQQAGSNPLHTGAFFTAGTSSTEISSGGDYNVDYVNVINATSGSNGTLTIGYALSGTVACNWTGFDNFRLYYYGAIVTPVLTISANSLTFPIPGTKKVAVTGMNLTNDITITAPTHFSVSPSTLLKTVAGDSVAITYAGGSNASGYVVFASGAKKDSVQVTGSIDPTIVPSATSLVLDNVAFKDSITVSSTNLANDLTITPPAGITVSPTTIAVPGASNVKVLITYDKTTLVNGNIALTSGTLTVNVAVKASSNSGCYTPAYASGNMIADPTFSAATLEAGGFGGWGTVGRRLTHTRQYCGRGAAYILGTCWDKGGSLDRSLNTANGNALKPNTKYRLRAMINSQASAGKTFQFQIEGVNGTASQFFPIGNTGGWKQIDTTFITGATVTTGKGIYFNSCTNATPAITDTCFIDNYELYNITPYATLSNLTVNGTKVAGFDSTVYTYGVIIPAIPTVAATAAVAGAVVEITQATVIPGSATVKVTSADGKVSNIYTINFSSFSTDASLSALTVSTGTLNPAFATATNTYYVELPSGSAIPTVTPTTTDSKATAVVTAATAIPDTTIVKVTAEDGTSTKTYMVNFWDLKLTGTVIGHASSWNNDPATYIAAAFDGNTATFVDAPTATGYVGLDLGAGKKAKITSMRYFPRTTHASRMEGGEIRGANKADLSDAEVLYTITATPSTVSYTDVILSVAKSYRYIYYYSANGYCNIAELELYGVTTEYNTDATLSDLTIDGTQVTGFAANVYTYNVELPLGTTIVPTVAATKNYAGATVVVTPAASLPGSTTVDVTAEDGTTLTYTINFTVIKSTDATLSDLKIDGTQVTGFASNVYTYNVLLSAGTTTVPTITATVNQANATTVITPAASVTGSGTVVVTAQDGTTTKTYTVNFSLATLATPVASAATSVAKTSFSANWAAVTGATGYFLDVATDNAFTAFVTGFNNKDVANVTTFSVTGLTAATTYYYRVRATNGTASANSNTISVLSLGTDVQSLAANGVRIAVTANAVELESGNAIVSVKVVNVSGMLMAEKSFNATKVTISTEGWASGIYVFTIKTQGQVMTTKLGIVK